jgi:hypothetical protein
MKARLVLLFIVISVMPTFAQITGGFILGDDDEIYFQCNNRSGINIPSTTVVLLTKSGQQWTLNSAGWWNNGTTFYIGPNFNWSWEKGEQAHLYITTYNNYGPVTNDIGYWTCPINKPTTWDKIMDFLDGRPKARVKGLGKGWGSKVLKFLKKVK